MKLIYHPLKMKPLETEHSEVLKAAHEAGYFEHPRRTPGTEIAESLELDPATFQRRLQGALAVCVEEYLAESGEKNGCD